MMKRILSVLLAIVMLVGLLPMAALAATEPEEPDGKWYVSKSKTAAPLDKDYRSQVTLSLPSAEEELVSDVVFVLDESSCSAPVKEEVAAMLADLYDQVKDTGASIKIGAVQFRGEVTELPLTVLTEDTKDTVTAFMGERPKIGGSNMSAGLLAGEKMLDKDTSVENSRKYLILVSDGITYIWDDEATEEQENLGVNFAGGDYPDKPFLAGPDGWDVKHCNGYVPTNWKTELETIQSLMDKTIAEKASEYVRGADISGKPFVHYNERNDYATTVDIALYKSYAAYQDIASKYNAFVVLTGVESEMNTYPYGPSFMRYLADGKPVSFETIQKEIYYLIDAGSKVKDVIGYGKDDKDNDYNFDFVNDINKLTLTVGKETLKTEALDVSGTETAAYGFGKLDDSSRYDYAFVLRYYENGVDGDPDECFVWDINVPVSNFAPVQLTYTVKLTNPQTKSGTYGEFDPDGSHGKTALYTNNSAILYPRDTSGTEGTSEEFPKPTVSYTVGASGGILVLPPVLLLNTEDHISYLVGYADGTIRPEGKITRGEVATIFFRLLTQEARSANFAQTNPYSDVTRDLWCNNAISTLSGMGIIDGYSDGTFRPNAPITRAEFAKIAIGFCNMESGAYQGTFTDVPEGKWYTPYVEAAAQAGLIYGADGKFRPGDNITRAEASAIVNRLLGRHPHKDHLLPSYSMINWPDCSIDAWYYADMMEATNSHSYMRMQTASYVYGSESWTGKLPQPDWTALEHTWVDAYTGVR